MVAPCVCSQRWPYVLPLRPAAAGWSCASRRYSGPGPQCRSKSVQRGCVTIQSMCKNLDLVAEPGLGHRHAGSRICSLSGKTIIPFSKCSILKVARFSSFFPRINQKPFTIAFTMSTTSMTENTDLHIGICQRCGLCSHTIDIDELFVACKLCWTNIDMH